MADTNKMIKVDIFMNNFLKYMVHGEVQFGFKIAVKHKIHAKIWQILF